MTIKTMNQSSETTKQKKPYMLSTELFSNRNDIPDFIKNHHAFKTDVKVSKIFPSIGLKNFQEPCKIAKPLIDLKKENFITPFLTVIFNELKKAETLTQKDVDKYTYLWSPKQQEENAERFVKLKKLLFMLRGLSHQMDTVNHAYEKVVHNSEGKIVFRLYDNVVDEKAEPIFKKDEVLLRVLNKVRTQCTEAGVAFFDYNQSAEFKTFSTENVPNKTFKICFSSDGREGAWDILTMSMRGIKSCQNWGSDYPQCLIGSVLSRYVGIIYITSGAEMEFTVDVSTKVQPNNQRITGKGLKMMRRAVVRYAIDIDENKPCILIDKLYPPQSNAELDAETVKAFKEALSSKTNIPVHYAPTLGTKIRHFYVPYEKSREIINESEWSYQDTGLKTDLDFKMNTLNASSSEASKYYIDFFRSKFALKFNEAINDILISKRQIGIDPEIVRVFANMKFNNRIDQFTKNICNAILTKSNIGYPNVSSDPKEYYRKYLIQTATNLKNVKRDQFDNLIHYTRDATSRDNNYKVFIDYLFDTLIKNIFIQEVKENVH